MPAAHQHYPMRIGLGRSTTSAARLLALVAAALFGFPSAALVPCAFGQRTLGLDVSAHQGEISQTQWNSIYSTDDRKFVFIRSSRGGTSGEDHRQGGYPAGDSTFFNLSQRYDDPYFIQNITRATAAGLMAGPYHFARLDVIESTTNSNGIANTGADEANHFVQMAGPYMRPGYLMPTYDLESGQTFRTNEQIAQFTLDFSNRVYQSTNIRPAIYINGSYSSILQAASVGLRNQLAQPLGPQPSVVSPGYSMLWNARYAVPVNVQVDNPKDTASTFYGPWDDYGDTQPWNFWQYTSTGSVTGISPVDLNVSHGDLEYVKDFLVPAVWMNNADGDWSTLSNWNSGQAVTAPPAMPGQLTPFATGPLPTPRLPGAPNAVDEAPITSGVNDTVILERPDANVTVTVSSGIHNIRKLYMRESLNITGGSLTINYDPTYRPNNSATVRHSGPISAQFSGPVTLSGSGALSVHTLQVDAGQTFNVAGGSLNFTRINLMPGFVTPARMLLGTNLNITPSGSNTVEINNVPGFGVAGQLDLNGSNRTFNVNDGAASVDFSVSAAVVNGAVTKTGAGTMRLAAANTYSGGTTVSGGRLFVSNTSGSGTGSGNVSMAAGTTLGGSGSIAGAVTLNAATIAPGESIGALAVGQLTFTPGSLFAYEYSSGATLVADRLDIAGGGLNIPSNVGLNVTNLGAGQVPLDTKLTLISYNGSWDGGLFNGYANDSLFNYGGNEFRIDYDDTPAGAANGGSQPNAVTLTVTVGPVQTTINGFRAYYAPPQWLTSGALLGAFVNTADAPGTITINGPNDGSGQFGDIKYTIEAAGSGAFSFDWLYTSTDSPNWDFAYYINGLETFLSTTNNTSGYVSVPVNSGDLIGWRVTSSDSSFGAGVLKISNFSAPALIPEPAAASLLISALFAAASARRRTPQRKLTCCPLHLV